MNIFCSSFDLSSRARGSVDVFMKNMDGTETPLMSFSNLILYSGADILASALSGLPGGVVNGMYMEYKNDAIGVGPSVTRDRDASYYTSLSGDYGYCRVPTISGVTSSSGADYEGNEITFVAITDGTYGGGALTDGVSRFYGAGLISSPAWSDPSSDRLFSALNFEASSVLTPVIKAANAQFGVRWKIRFK
jgi:hypothetical protein